MNEGFGGPDNHHPVSGDYKDIQSLNKLIGETFPRMGFEYNPEGYKQDLDSVVCDLVNDFLNKREFRKALKKFVFIQDGKLFTIKKAKHTTLEKVRNAPCSKGAIFLADLPEDKAFDLYLKHA